MRSISELQTSDFVDWDWLCRFWPWPQPLKLDLDPWPYTVLKDSKMGCHNTIFYNLTLNFDLQSQPSQGQGRPSCKKARSKVKRFKQETPDIQTDATKHIISLLRGQLHKNLALEWHKSIIMVMKDYCKIPFNSGYSIFLCNVCKYDRNKTWKQCMAVHQFYEFINHFSMDAPNTISIRNCKVTFLNSS